MKLAIDDRFLAALLDGTIPVQIHGKLYSASKDTPVIGDKVLDRQDGKHGIVDGIYNNCAAVRDGMAIELGIAMERLVKLVVKKT